MIELQAVTEASSHSTCSLDALFPHDQLIVIDLAWFGLDIIYFNFDNDTETVTVKNALFIPTFDFLKLHR